MAKAAIAPNAASQGASRTPTIPTVAGISSNTIPLQSNTCHLTEQIPKIQALALHLERKGKSKNTIRGITRDLTLLAQRADLNNPTDIELAIARYIKKNKRPATNNYKNKLCVSYNAYLKFKGIKWETPKYTKEDITIVPPTNPRIEMLIASARSTLSLKLDVSYQTGLRPIEIQGEKGLQVKNIHFDTHSITARITKGCNARPPMTIKEPLMARLQTYITKNNLKPDDLLFAGKEERYIQHFIRFKNALAKRLNDPTIKTIRLYDIRHAYATTKLLKIQNAETVRIIMGHKNLNTTQRYLHLLNTENGEWIVEGTTDKKRAEELLLNDFTYQLTTPDGTMLFRKPK